MTVSELAIGVVAESPQQLHDLSQLVQDAGHRVAGSVNVSQRLPDALVSADAWLVRLDAYYDHAQPLLSRLDTDAVPVIYDDCEGSGTHNQERSRRVAQKLRQLAGRQDSWRTARRAREVWVVAASAGGPEAVTEFLRGLAGIPDSVALLYVQHIGTESSTVLKQVVDKNSRWQVYATDQFCVLEENCLYVVSPRSALEIGGDGSVQSTGEPWQGPYSPSVDQVMAKVARRYGARSGAIIFSGMGDDGRRSCEFMQRLGGQVWAQEPSTCTVDSMPRCAIESGCVSFVGSPAALAQRFNEQRLSPQSLTQSG